MARMGPVKFAPPEKSLAHAAGLIAARASGGHTLGGCMIRWRANEIMVGREAAALDASPPVPLARTGSVWDRRFFVEIREGKKAKTGLFAAPLGVRGWAGLRVPACKCQKPCRVAISMFYQQFLIQMAWFHARFWKRKMRSAWCHGSRRCHIYPKSPARQGGNVTRRPLYL